MTSNNDPAFDPEKLSELFMLFLLVALIFPVDDRIELVLDRLPILPRSASWFIELRVEFGVESLRGAQIIEGRECLTEEDLDAILDLFSNNCWLS